MLLHFIPVRFLRTSPVPDKLGGPCERWEETRTPGVVIPEVSSVNVRLKISLCWLFSVSSPVLRSYKQGIMRGTVTHLTTRRKEIGFGYDRQLDERGCRHRSCPKDIDERGTDSGNPGPHHL